jgi:two-component system nitrogen regulation sensor histidine kinase NtrY
VVLAVEDDGAGIADEHRERIFEPFFTTKAKGTGLGLAIIARLIEDHGGVITLEPPQSLRGARFVVRLPRPPG